MIVFRFDFSNGRTRVPCEDVFTQVVLRNGLPRLHRA